MPVIMPLIRPYHITWPKPIRVRGVEAAGERVRSQVEARVEARAEARVGRGSRAMALRPESYSILVVDVPGVGRVQYTVPPVQPSSP